MNLFVLITCVVLMDTTYAQHLLSCPDNECWCCPFEAGQCYNEVEKTPCCCETADSYPCYEASEAYQCCETGTTCCYDGCCPPGTTCCGEEQCCYDQPYYFYGYCVPSERWIKPIGTEHPKRNLTGAEGACGSSNCFCCCEDLICPIQESGSTESCIERSEDIDMYCNEISPCPQQESRKMLWRKQHLVFTKHPRNYSTSKVRLEKPKFDVIDMTHITLIRNKLYQHQEGQKTKNFQFAVFKFGPSASDWQPAIDDSGINWSNSLVVDDAQNTWQASSFASCRDGCHTETAIISDSGHSGFHAMLVHECDQEPPHALNIYSFNSPCITGPGLGCQQLIQTTISHFFGNALGKPCNEHKWEINIAWTLQFRDQSADECLLNWREWGADLSEDHPNVMVICGQQSVGEITDNETKLNVSRFSLAVRFLSKIAIIIGLIAILLLSFKLLKR